MVYAPELNGTFVRKSSNGFGYEFWVPERPKSLDTIRPPENDGTIVFSELGRIVSTLQTIQGGGLLVWGEPGSGKSHLRDDLVVHGGIKQQVPYLTVSLHINGGNPKGPERLSEAIDTLSSAGDGKKLVVFDNVDYLGYKGKSRRQRQTKEYAEQVSEIIRDTIATPEYAVVGIAHDPDWRAGRWRWNNPQIDTPAHSALEAFGTQYAFQGTLTNFGVEDTLRERGIQDEEFSALLAADESLRTFFYAGHLEPAAFRASPQAEMKRIADVRQQMKSQQ